MRNYFLTEETLTQWYRLYTYAFSGWWHITHMYVLAAGYTTFVPTAGFATPFRHTQHLTTSIQDLTKTEKASLIEKKIKFFLQLQKFILI